MLIVVGDGIYDATGFLYLSVSQLMFSPSVDLSGPALSYFGLKLACIGSRRSKGILMKPDDFGFKSKTVKAKERMGWVLYLLLI